MKIALDISPLKSSHRFRGIGSYTQNLVDAFQKFPQKNLEIVLVEKGPIPADIDLIHYPYFDLFFLTLPLKKIKKTIVTIHDVTRLVFPQNYPPGIKGKLKFQIQKASLKGVSAVICDSQNSKKDIVKFLNYPASQIHVVYLAPAQFFKPLPAPSLKKIKEKYSLPDKFVLYVGDIDYNKNILSLAAASKKIKTPLVIVGQQAVEKDFDQAHIENQPLVQLIKLYGDDPDIIRLGFVPNDDLVALYNLATVYCQPSFYEGFGFPVLEAMACGCPVVASNQASLPEVAGSAALLVDPDQDKIAQALKKVIKSKSLSQKLIKAGFNQAKLFTWEKTARQTYEVYQKV